MTIDTLSNTIAKHLESKGFTDLQVMTIACTLEDSKRILILLSQKDVLVLGLLSTLYTLKGQKVVYIDKLDTSGYYKKTQRASLTQSLVQGFLSTLGQCRLHVFARAQPQFLFPESAKNPLKHVLSERALVKWWAKTLSDAGSKGWYFVPGESQCTVRDIASQLTQDWSFGWPWPKDAKASEVIPKFSDDAKVKALDLIGPEGTMADFSEILSLTGECGSGRFSGFFILDLKGTSEVECSATMVSQSDFLALERLLLSGSFENLKSSLDASRKVMDGFIAHEARLAIVSNKIALSEQKDAKEDLKRPVVQDISSLVKRKKPKI